MSAPWGRGARILSCLMALLWTGCVHGTGFLAGFVAIGQESKGPPPVILVLLDGEKVDLEGDLAEELRQIPDAQVRVTGTLRGKPPHRRFEVKDYQIVDDGEGAIPHVGLLQWDSGRLLLIEGPGQPIITLIGDKAMDLRTAVGGRVWVVGPIVEQEKLQVLSFGVLKPPSHR